MGFDSNLGGSPSSSSPSGKRTRDPEEEVYVDNLRSHKRYLSEVKHRCLSHLPFVPVFVLLLLFFIFYFKKFNLHITSKILVFFSIQCFNFNI
jgi:hypothetical protein